MRVIAARRARVAEQLGINPGTLRNWVTWARSMPASDLGRAQAMRSGPPNSSGRTASCARRTRSCVARPWSAGPATHTTMPSPRHSTRCSRPARPQPWPLAQHRRSRGRQRRVHRLVPPPTRARRDRPGPPDRVRGQPLPAQPGPGCRRVSSQPPLNPARDRHQSTDP